MISQLTAAGYVRRARFTCVIGWRPVITFYTSTLIMHLAIAETIRMLSLRCPAVRGTLSQKMDV